MKELLGRRFYFFMSLLSAAVVLIGFTPRFESRMIHPTHPVPLALWIHTIVFTLWIILTVVQSGLVQAGNVAWHRRLGLASLGFGPLLVGVGIWVAYVSGHAQLQGGGKGAEAFFAIPLSNMATFAAFFTAALVWRKRPEYHKRLMLLATLGLTVAALARFPAWIVPAGRFNIAVDVLIGLALLRDLIVEQRIHRVYLVCFPLLIAVQLLVEWIRQTPEWISFAGQMLQ
jgi:uncharacterized membrane protein YozB (DUF420 family)